mgnify:CR=1 FL=1
MISLYTNCKLWAIFTQLWLSQMLIPLSIILCLSFSDKIKKLLIALEIDSEVIPQLIALSSFKKSPVFTMNLL